MLHLYDTATREVRELGLRSPGEVSIYLCGPTVYGPPHLGHGRATLVYDILRRDTLVLTKDAVDQLTERLK